MKGVAVFVHDVFAVTDMGLACPDKSLAGFVPILPLLDLLGLLLVFSLSFPVGTLDGGSHLPLAILLRAGEPWGSLSMAFPKALFFPALALTARPSLIFFFISRPVG